MTLLAGDLLAQYRITSALGAGGMGEVFRATDTKLDRDVAIKVLPAEVAQDRERLARFEREAKLLASLNHPNIAHVYGFESATLPDGSTAHFLAMELVPGEDLAERLKRGAIPVDEAIAIAKQIAEGLEEAHEHGIIHRDLKPANVKLTPDGKVKVLDFGLAKALDAGSGSGSASSQLSHSPTMSRNMTEAGMIMGTAAYMSPEQARGKAVDKRADIWSFGVVLFEMLTGERLFAGETVSDVLAGVLKTEIEFGALPPDTPASVRRLLRACLERNPKSRLHDVADARLAIDGSLAEPALDAATSGLSLRTAPTPAWRTAFPWALSALLLIVLAYDRWPRATPPVRPTRLEVQLTPADDLSVNGNSDGAIVALSPGGETLVYLAAVGPIRQLFARQLDQLEATPLAGTENATAHFFSPDGRSVAFFANGQLMRTALSGGAPAPVTPAPDGRGGSWGPGDIIVYTGSTQEGLSRVSAGGGAPTPVTKLGLGERTHRWPTILPDGKHVLFTCQTFTGTYDDGTIEVARIDNGERKVLVRGGTFPRYVGGYLVYSRGTSLYALRFDLDALETRGEPQVVLSGFLSGGAVSGSGVGGTGAAQIALADNGTAVYLTGAVADPTTPVRLVVVDRSGRTLYEYPESRLFRDPTLSPDGRQIAVRIDAANGPAQVYLLDIQRGILNQMTFLTYDTALPVWSRDGRRLALASGPDLGRTSVFLMPSDGSSEPKPLAASKSLSFPTSFSPDDRLLAISRVEFANGRPNFDIEVVSLADGVVTPFLNTPYRESNGRFSPDGKWITFLMTDASATGDIYVRAWPGGGALRRVSTGGGLNPVWSRNGREVLYLDFTGRVNAVDVTPQGDALLIGNPRILFDRTVALLSNTDGLLDAAADGSRFVMLEAEARSAVPKRTHVTLVFNFLEEIRQATAAERK